MSDATPDARVNLTATAKAKEKRTKVLAKKKELNKKHEEEKERKGRELVELCDFYEPIADMTHEDVAKAFVAESKGDIVIVDSGRLVIGYQWNNNQSLWVKSNAVDMRHLISDLLVPKLQRFVVLLEWSGSDENSNPEYKKKTDKYIDKAMKLIANIKTLSFQKAVFEMSIHSLLDKSFPEKLNKVPHLFPTDDGNVVDLRTGETRKRVKDDMFSFCCPVVLDRSEEGLKIVDQYFMSLFMENREMVEYFTRILGYFLSGETGDRSFYIWYGIGRNGKSKLMDLMKKILTSQWCGVLSRGAVIKSRANDRHSGRATTELNKLEYLRLAYFNESEDGDELNESVLKNVSGNDDIAGRKLMNEESEFKSQAKVFLSTNHRAVWRFDDQAMLDRARQIPAEVRFVPREIKEEELKEFERYGDNQLLLDLEGKYLNSVFTYLVDKCKDYYRFYQANSSIPVPEKCSDSVKQLIHDSDTVRQFLEECCETSESSSEKGGLLYKHYVEYTKSNGKKVLANNKFSEDLEKKGYVKKRSSSGMKWLGIRLLVDEHDDTFYS